jgi:hypothetical protein
MKKNLQSVLFILLAFSLIQSCGSGELEKSDLQEGDIKEAEQITSTSCLIDTSEIGGCKI